MSEPFSEDDDTLDPTYQPSPNSTSKFLKILF